MKREHLRRYFRHMGIRRYEIDELLRYARKGGLTYTEAYEVAETMWWLKKVAQAVRSRQQEEGAHTDA